jgi:dTDP-4-amino-4,6-dideoxygalactose transaminase
VDPSTSVEDVGNPKRAKMIKVPFIDLGAQFRTIQSEIMSALTSVLNESAYIGGKYVETFERQFAAYSGRKHCIGCGNGTDAIEIALQSLGVGPGDEVLVPANSFIATSEAVTTVGAVPVFVDVDPTTYTIDPGKLEASLTKKTKVIIPVHLFGLPAEMDPILEFARKHGLLVVEDCAQAHGATYRGKKVGTFGHAATFSFYPGKNLGAYGDAGAILVDSDEWSLKSRAIRDHGALEKYQHLIEGRNSRLDGMQAAVLSVKLAHLESWTEQRIRLAKEYAQSLSEVEVVLPRYGEHSRHVFHLYVVQVDDRDRVKHQLQERGIGTGIHYPTALPHLKAYARFGFSKSDFPVSTALSQRILSLPMYAELTSEQTDYVSTTLKSVLKV